MPVIRLSGTNKELYRFAPLQLAEFVPVVQIDKVSFKTDRIAIITENDDVELSERIDTGKRIIPLCTIVTSPGTLTIPFRIDKRNSSYDSDGMLIAKLSIPSSSVIVTPDKEFKAKIGQNFELQIKIAGNQKKQFYIDFLASDDGDDFVQIDNNGLLCGRIQIQVFPDVFTEYEVNQLIEEIYFIQPFADSQSPSEYAGNYCMSAAERGLSKLLNNSTDFYSVDRSHSRLNAIDFEGKNADSRGEEFQAGGFVESSFIFSEYQIDMNLLFATKNDTDLLTNAYDVVLLNSGSNLQTYIQNYINNKCGFHVFYLSITDAFHTLLLIVDNRVIGNETYAIYDQHGKTSSNGALADIENGFARQTSWTYLNFYRNNGYNAKIRSGVTTKIWKIRRKT